MQVWRNFGDFCVSTLGTARGILLRAEWICHQCGGLMQKQSGCLREGKLGKGVNF